MARKNEQIVVAHLGAHKTATSLVQKYFDSKKRYYAGKGINFITRSEISTHIGWGNKIVENPEAFRQQIGEAARASNAPYILFSNENVLGRPFPKGKSGLYANHQRVIPALGKALNEFPTRIVYSIRPQWELLESYYLQRVHEGYYLTFSQFIENINLKKLHWSPIIEGLVSEFGKENVTVMDFGLIKKGQDVFLSEFIKRNISSTIKPDLDYDTVHNASISDRGLQLALRINPLLKKGETGKVRRFLQENFSNLTEPRPVLLSPELREDLKSRYQDEYLQLTGQFN